ncbi:MAG TPA: hypothetical protein VGD56_05960 [Gemmatirosa sp.]
MPRVSLPAHTAADWRALLTHPERHWRAGRSAHALAHAWQRAADDAPGGMPPEVRAVLAGHPTLADATALLVIPAHETPLPGAGAGSHTDALVLARGADGLAVIAVEGTAGEPFGPTVGEWRVDASPGKEARLAYLRGVLGLHAVPDGIRYQLVHRTAAALLEADAYAARHAVVLVHAFERAAKPAAAAAPPVARPAAPPAGFADYAAFVRLFGADARVGALATVERADGRLLHFGWAQGTPAPADPPTADETLCDQLGAILGGAVMSDVSALLTYGDPVEVLVRADPHAVHVEVPVVEWRGHAPVLTGERRASFPREAVTRFGGEAPFIEAVLAARAERVARFRTCAECGERNPPEWLHSATLCSRCATARRGVVY